MPFAGRRLDRRTAQYAGPMDRWDMNDGVVELPDGKRVRGTGLRRPRRDVPVPDFAVYLLGRDPQVPDREYRWVRWRDFRLPDSTEQAVAALREAHTRAASERVEIACGGGVGRTGTAMAVLAIMSGVSPDDAVAWVRANYHPRAVETPWQRRWVGSVATSVSP
jgi:protein-tyrosine phosphatase